MKLQTNCAWRQMNLLRGARHAGGLHHRKKQFKLVDVHWHSWGTRTPGKPGVLSESPKIGRIIHRAQALTSSARDPAIEGYKDVCCNEDVRQSESDRTATWLNSRTFFEVGCAHGSLLQMAPQWRRKWKNFDLVWTADRRSTHGHLDVRNGRCGNQRNSRHISFKWFHGNIEFSHNSYLFSARNPPSTCYVVGEERSSSSNYDVTLPIALRRWIHLARGMKMFAKKLTTGTIWPTT